MNSTQGLGNAKRIYIPGGGWLSLGHPHTFRLRECCPIQPRTIYRINPDQKFLQFPALLCLEFNARRAHIHFAFIERE